MRTLSPLLILLSAASLAAACSSDTAPNAPVDADIAGSWARDFGTQVLEGTSYGFTLSEANGVITGSGVATGEAIAPDSLAISGTIANDSVHLQVIAKLEPQLGVLPPDTATFDGRLVSKNELDGVLTVDGFSTTIKLVRPATVQGSPTSG